MAQWRSGAVAQWRSGAVAQWLELRTLDKENPRMNLMLPNKTVGDYVYSTLFQFTQLYDSVPDYTKWLAFVYAYLRALIAALLDYSQMRRDGVRLNRFAR